MHAAQDIVTPETKSGTAGARPARKRRRPLTVRDRRQLEQALATSTARLRPVGVAVGNPDAACAFLESKSFDCTRRWVGSWDLERYGLAAEWGYEVSGMTIDEDDGSPVADYSIVLAPAPEPTVERVGAGAQPACG